ncbi:hypothetical protein [Nocardia transvalensis]|uniref:hypothetical protein n=1 Tax=Nocardia transvalensis TaxID=37333 RepID=UPI001894D2D5|nr:hypothetical protein [Nocardia transvalensis]MBF6328163.1 hypothetical protein [Nocardia transvalensis]
MRSPTMTAVVVLAVSLAASACGSSGGTHEAAATSTPVPHSTVAAPKSSPTTAAPSPSDAPGSTTAEPTSSVAAATTSVQMASRKCATQQWPQALPDLRGQRLAQVVVGSALCFDIVAVTATDGHDVMHDPKSFLIPWKVTDQSPEPGTSVTASTPVSLTVAPG